MKQMLLLALALLPLKVSAQTLTTACQRDIERAFFSLGRDSNCGRAVLDLREPLQAAAATLSNDESCAPAVGTVLGLSTSDSTRRRALAEALMNAGSSESDRAHRDRRARLWERLRERAGRRVAAWRRMDRMGYMSFADWERFRTSTIMSHHLCGRPGEEIDEACVDAVNQYAPVLRAGSDDFEGASFSYDDWMNYILLGSAPSGVCDTSSGTGIRASSASVALGRGTTPPPGISADACISTASGFRSLVRAHYEDLLATETGGVLAARALSVLPHAAATGVVSTRGIAGAEILSVCRLNGVVGSRAEPRGHVRVAACGHDVSLSVADYPETRDELVIALLESRIADSAAPASEHRRLSGCLESFRAATSTEHHAGSGASPATE
jgi:hypothetical protein